MEIVK
jgi:hypothetical protein